jgi:hypothetical protein
MKELFSRKFAPITDTIGFLRCDSDRVAKAFLDWQSGIQNKRGVALVESKIQGELESEIRRLLPLTSVERRRYLFIPTRSNWTAFFDNGHQGTDAFSHISYLAEKLACEGIRVTFISDSQSEQYPATILEIFGPNKTDFLNRVRSISVAFDGRRWVFSAEGAVQPFEDIQRYTDRVMKNRFTSEMLEAYLEHLEIEAFDERFYGPNGEAAIFVEKVGPIAPAAREFGLADV